MSYCVNCGVELAPSEKKCPLCTVEVQNPLQPWQEPAERPYAGNVEKIVKRIDRQYLAGLLGLILIIPVAVCLLADLLDGDISWSLLVLGAMLNLFVCFLVPMLYKKANPFVFLLYDTLAVSTYLFLIETTAKGSWFFPLALPITLCVAALHAVLMLWFYSKKRRPFSLSCGFVVLGIGVLCVCINMLINAFMGISILPTWSLYALSPCVVLFVFFLVLNKRNRWKDSIRKRLFM